MIALQHLPTELLAWISGAFAVALCLRLHAMLPPPEAEANDAVLAALGAL